MRCSPAQWFTFHLLRLLREYFMPRYKIIILTIICNKLNVHLHTFFHYWHKILTTGKKKSSLNLFSWHNFLINKLLIVPIIIRCWYTNSLRKVPLCIDVKFKRINTIYNTIAPCYECLFYSLFLFRIKMLTQINKNKQWNS